jgi:hypothetical protein
MTYAVASQRIRKADKAVDGESSEPAKAGDPEGAKEIA